MVQDPSVSDGQEHWQPSGIIEYRLDDGSLVDAHADGAMRVVRSGVSLTRQ
jgi:hypothetical protein